MRLAIIGSRSVSEDVMEKILLNMPSGVTELVSGGAEGVDTMAQQVAKSLDIPIRVFRPDYEQYGKRAPLVRNREILEYADEVLAFWDGASKGTQHVILECLKLYKPVKIIPLTK